MKILISLFLFLLLALNFGCNRQESPLLFQIVDSEVWCSNTAGGEKTYWLDNDRVLFLSSREYSPNGSASALTVWNPASGQVKSFHGVSNLICSEGGTIFFASRDDASAIPQFYRGPLENLVEHPPLSSGLVWDRNFECDWATPGSRAKVPFLIKLKGENFLEVLEYETYSLKSGIQHGEVQYYERLNSPSVPLPIYAEPAGNYTIEFNRSRNAYFIGPRQYYPDDPYYHSVWWLERDGTLTKEPFLPKMSWTSGASLRVYPLKDGYLVHYQGGKATMTSTGPMGLYLMQGEKVDPVLLGMVAGVSVSPDGCNAAFVHARTIKEYLSCDKPHRTVKAINFCNGSTDK